MLPKISNNSMVISIHTSIHANLMDLFENPWTVSKLLKYEWLYRKADIDLISRPFGLKANGYFRTTPGLIGSIVLVDPIFSMAETITR